MFLMAKRNSRGMISSSLQTVILQFTYRISIRLDFRPVLAVQSKCRFDMTHNPLESLEFQFLYAVIACTIWIGKLLERIFCCSSSSTPPPRRHLSVIPGRRLRTGDSFASPSQYIIPFPSREARGDLLSWTFAQKCSASASAVFAAGSLQPLDRWRNMHG